MSRRAARAMPSASVAPIEHGLHELTDNVVCVPLPLPMPDLQVVNAYVIHCPDGVTLVDPGWAYPPAETALLKALDRLGFAVGDVRRIVATHQHWDHYSLGVQWRDRYGIELMLGHEEHHSITAFARQPDEVHPGQVEMLIRAGAPQVATEIKALDWQEYERNVAFSPPDRWLTDGEVIDCGSVRMMVRTTPGHTRGHVVLHDARQGLIFTGDHLLPRITPSIAYERAPEHLPLRSYINSLRLMLDLPDARMLPAHGATERTTHARAHELIEHHETRLNRISELVAAGACTAYDVANQMLWTRRDLGLDDLPPVHRMTAILEVQSHLDVLELHGTLRSSDDAGVRSFAAA
ncbi:glyoxylase-like metal-dependent hydrolase (beta-lactamase superfamily II) [Mycolicibacterium sp. BK556]|uniref:MBL fold metallo-hydrolase n=2 Tax=unclassified Mycolicibacterium TaxID=2636767 RepID=UPI0017A5721C|nr:glyoxylase-like metal-dependent hydrolase (beta-lactamase superfamily II) [Mycolicibacterium sp. BK556]MBB3634537.1 glyoxylase-like metal-dependent hydrolase (beta-lactamase superfamily II) [Mycolicibacterium sp. BK607]